MISEETRNYILQFQRTELTEHYIYESLAKRTSGRNSVVLKKIADDELRHYNKWKEFTGVEIKPSRVAIFLYLLIARIFGITFAIKLMEREEGKSQMNYGKVAEEVPMAKELIKEELEHEELLIGMIDEERIGYIGSMVLGLNDALVELTGALAGLTFALQNTILVGVAALITGLAASLSMAASEYLSKKSEGSGSPGKAALYTGIAYVITVVILVFPYFIFYYHYLALSFTLINVVIIISIFTFFVSVVKDISFKREFGEMLAISLGIAVVSFMIGVVMRIVFNLEI
jgi:VIT1/CCC1 family predicted Fe2+/Mn2+ transporter